jgi:hypothetical protein
MRPALPILLLALSACIQPGSRAPDEPVATDDEGVPVGDIDDIAELRRAITRAQFEAPRHGSEGHAAFGCPQCADPMRGRVPEEALIDGPAEVWN